MGELYAVYDWLLDRVERNQPDGSHEDLLNMFNMG